MPSHHPAHTRQLGSCHWAEAPTRAANNRASSSSSRGPQVTAHTPVELRPTDDDGPHPPDPPGQLKWVRVTDLVAVSELEALANLLEWTQLNGGDVAWGEHNCRALRSCEPRFNLAQFESRSTFASFPDHSHANGHWWQLEDENLLEPQLQALALRLQCTFLPAGVSSS